MNYRCLLVSLALAAHLVWVMPSASEQDKVNPRPLNANPLPIGADLSVKYDYDIVYVRAPRDPSRKIIFAEANLPMWMDPGADLILLHPDGTEEMLVEGGGDGAVVDPFISFDGEWVYYAHLRSIRNLRASSSDIYRVHVKSRKVVRLTHQEFTPNTGMIGNVKSPPQGIFNLGPCPLPGGRVIFVSSRNGFIPPKSYAPVPVLQLFVMDDDGSNVELIGPLNIGGALHPVVLKDGRVMFSSFESQGLRGLGLWGLWSIHPDGTYWQPLLSAFNNGSVDQITHFQTQLSNGNIVIEEYYNQNNWGFGTYYIFPMEVPSGVPAFGPAYLKDPRNQLQRLSSQTGNRYGIFEKRLPFSPYGSTTLTPFTHPFDREAPLSDPSKPDSPRLGKFTHPSAAPDNHMLTVWSSGPVNHNGHHLPIVDAGIYLIKDGKPIDEPAQMLLIKNDPRYNEQWPRALVPYKRIYGIDQPQLLPRLANDGKLSQDLPEGTPYGLVGTSSFYKRESYPNGRLFPGRVTATYANDGYDRSGYEGLGAFNPQDEHGTPFAHWRQQGSEAGRYSNSDIHAVRILAMEPTTDRGEQRRFFSFAKERLRILGEVPLRKFQGDQQPTDPDGNPDTSFLAKIPADTVFTFQTLDKDGMLLNMAQTWHQLRPGEIRNDCGGCHAHSQKPTSFRDTSAGRPDYRIFDLTEQSVLLTEKARDESGKKWDTQDTTGLRYEKGIKNVEFYRDVKPILDRSCVACHTRKTVNEGHQPPGNLVLDDDDVLKNVEFPYYGNIGPVSGTYFRLALDHQAKYGYKPLIASWRGQPTRYIRPFQARRSLLIWKVSGWRTDGWSNDDFPTETVPGDPKTLHWKGQPIPDTNENRQRADLDYTGSVMPPPEAIAGTYVGSNGKKIKVQPLTDEDRRTLVRWIDLGCPIDLDYEVVKSQARGYGWMGDDVRPTLTLTYPRPGANPTLTRILVGMHDYYSGLDLESFQVVADFPIEGVAAGKNLAGKFKPQTQGVWEWVLAAPLNNIAKGKLMVSVKDRQGNTARIERVFSVGASTGNERAFSADR